MIDTHKVVHKYLPWLVAAALFMEQLDATIVNTAVPSMAQSLHVTPFSLKAVVASYILSLAVFIPISGFLADKFGTKKIFATAAIIFVFASVACGLSTNISMLVVARLLQGMGGAMMMPVGRLAILRTFPKSQLLTAMNFVIIPALIGPLIGPTVGGIIVEFLSWRYIFFINLPIGIFALYMIFKYMPDYYGNRKRRLDFIGFVLFGSGIALLSWLLEIFGEYEHRLLTILSLGSMALVLLIAYIWHAWDMEDPLLKLSIFRVRTFRISILGGFITRLSIGGMPFLLPLLYQVGLGLPAWQSGMLMMPAALAAMSMKFVSKHTLQRFGYRQVLIGNTVMIGFTIASFSFVNNVGEFWLIILLGLLQGLFNSLQFSSMNSMAFADVSEEDVSMASTISSSFQQISMSFGLAMGTLITIWFLDDLPQSNIHAVITAIHHALWIMGALTIVSSSVFWSLRKNDGENISSGN